MINERDSTIPLNYKCYCHSSAGYDFISRASALGSLTVPHINAILAFFCGMEEDGNLSKLDVMYFTAAPFQSLANLNWIKSAHTLTSIGTPTWTKNVGYTGVTTSCVDTNFNPFTQGINVNKNSQSMFVYVHTDGSSTYAACGYKDVSLSKYTIITPRSSTSAQAALNYYSGGFTAAVSDSLGLTSITRKTTASKIYKRGVKIADLTVVNHNNLFNGNLYISAAQSLHFSPDAYPFPVSVFGAGNGDLDIAKLNIRITDYLTFLGANV